MTQSDCVSPDDVVAFVSGALDEAAAARLRLHVDECDDCRGLLGAAGEEVGAERGPSDDPDVVFAPGPDFDGRFRIESEIGRGSMGVVFSALHVSFNRRVALKFLRAEATADSARVMRFLRETRVAAKLTSPHAVRVLDVSRGTDGSPPYMVMELLEGEDLDRRVRREAIPIPEAVELMLQACHALAEAHDAGIVHRDVKLQNLFWAKTEAGPTLKVLDFGLAKGGSTVEAETSLTRRGILMGTPLYMSPEQVVSARDVDARADVWAIGVCLYRLVTGRFPFQGRSPVDLCRQIMGTDPKPPSTWRPDIPPQLEEVVMRCLARKVARRYANAGELRVALASTLDRGAPSLEAVERSEARSSRPIDWRIAALAIGACFAIGVVAVGRLGSSAKEPAVEASAPTVETASIPVASPVESAAPLPPAPGPTSSTPRVRTVPGRVDEPRRRLHPPPSARPAPRPSATNGSLFNTER